MRLELALIGGILFFCCWCAFIVARMNASVSSTGLQTSHQEHQHQQPPAPSGAGMQLSARPASGPDQSELHHHHHHHQLHQFNQQLQPSQASLEMINQVGPPMGQLQQQQQQQQWAAAPVSGQQQATPLHQWLEGRLQPQWNAGPSSGARPPVEVSPDYQVGGGQLDAGQAAAPSNHYNRQRDAPPPDEPDEPEPDRGAGPTSARASDQDEQDEAAPSDDDDHDDQGQVPGLAEVAAEEDENEDGQPEAGDPAGEPTRRLSELDEGARRRSFSENQLDSNERDRDGSLVSAWRRHLINGKPVGGHTTNTGPRRAAGPRIGQQSGPNEARPASERAAELERLVDQIDDEPGAADTLGSPNTIGRRSWEAAPVGGHSGPPTRGPVQSNATRPRGPPDRGLPVAAAPRVGALRRPKLGAPSVEPKKRDLHEHRLHESLAASQWDDSDQSRSDAADERLADDEARRLERLSRDLLVEAQSKADEDDDQPDQPAQPDDSDPDEEQPSELDRQVAELSGRSRLKRQALGGATPNNVATTLLAGQHTDVSEPASAEPSAPLDPQENISVEVLANLPRSTTLRNNNTTTQGPASPHLDQQPPAGPRASQPVQRNPYPNGPEQPMTFTPGASLADFPRIESPFQASGSHKRPTKSKRAKKKSRKWHQSDDKYQSARAHEARRKSARKKGKMYKLKGANSMRHSAARKHFKGSARGYKSQKGLGHKGANKGAQLFKDKGYKKRGFKKVYHKLETGDHKTYFDEFRDKDHKNRWKKFDDKHKYSKSKKWSGGDAKHLKHRKLARSKAKSSNGGHWSEKAKSSKRSKAAKNYASVAAESMGTGVKKGKRRRKTPSA